MKINLDKYMRISGYTAHSLSKELDISYPTMRGICNGTATSINLDTLEKLCAMFECMPNDILIPDYNKGKPHTLSMYDIDILNGQLSGSNFIPVKSDNKTIGYIPIIKIPVNEDDV